jgi:uncharacterized protein
VQRSRLFDFHARLAPDPGSTDRLLRLMDACQIARVAVSAGGVVDLDTLATNVMEGGYVVADADNEAVLDACNQTASRLVPFFFANPHSNIEKYRAAAPRFRGLEISPAVYGVPLTDKRVAALVEIATGHGHPVYVVCLGRPGYTAADLVTLAKRCPDTHFVLGHCGFVGIDVWSINHVAPQKNIFAELSGCYTRVARAAVDRLGADRVLFGTEYPLQHPDVELAKLRALGLRGDAWEQVAGRNARYLFGEETR